MGVAGARDVLGGSAELHGDDGFRDHIAGVGADQMDAEHAVGLGVGENFHETLGGLVHLGAPVRGHRKLADIVGDAGGFQFLFAFPDGRDFRIGVDHVRNGVVVHVAGLPDQDLGHRHPLVFRFMSQHRPGDNVADRPDAGDVCRVIMICDDAAALVELDAKLLEAEPVGVRHAADSDQHHIGLDGFRRAAFGRLDSRLQFRARCIDRRDLGRQLERYALLLEQALRLAAHLAIHAGQHAVEEFHHRYLGAEPAPHRAELEPDHAGADHQQMLRHLAEHQRAGRGDDALLVDLDAFQARHVGTGGDDDGFGVERLHLAVGAGDFDLAGDGDTAGAEISIDLVLLEQEVDALDVAVDALVLERHHRGEIELGRGDADAHFAEAMAGLLEQFGGVQQRLRRDAADIEAGAAEGRALFNDGGLQAQLGRADGADIAAGTGADDDEVVFVSH